MNFRRRIATEPLTLQLAPMIDVVMFLLCFFILTWNLARYEADLQIKIPTAKNAAEPKQLPGEVILNVTPDGSVNINRRTVNNTELREILTGLLKQYPDQPVVVRADETVSYKNIVNVLDICRGAGIWNVAFATVREKAAP